MRSLTRLMRAEIAHSYIITYLLRFANKKPQKTVLSFGDNLVYYRCATGCLVTNFQDFPLSAPAFPPALPPALPFFCFDLRAAF